MTSFKELEQVKFDLPNVVTWGVKKNKYGGYSIPIALDNETIEKISVLVKEHKTKNPLYGRTLYLKSDNLTEKQTDELYNKGKSAVEVRFTVKGVYTRNNTSYLIFRDEGLRKTDNEVETRDSCPKD